MRTATCFASLDEYSKGSVEIIGNDAGCSLILNNGIYISQSQNIIIANLRIRNASKYGILISSNSSRRISPG